MTRKETLDKAAECVLKNRQQVYGSPEDSFGTIAAFWSTYLGVKITPHQAAICLALLKVARIKGNASHEDSHCDLAGYAACAAELAPSIEKAQEAESFWNSVRELSASHLPAEALPPHLRSTPTC